MMKTLAERIAFLVSQRETLARWVGEFDEFSLKKWLSSELGDWRRLEQWVDGARVIPRQPVLHILSGNTEHAAFQSLVRALLIGCQSWVKVPSEGLPEFEQWAAQLAGVEVSRELPDAWRNPDLAVIYGGAESLDFFRNWLGQGTLRIEHGPRLSAAFVFAQREGIFPDLAADVLRYGQRGCLSVQMIYVAGNAEAFCEGLAAALGAAQASAEATVSEAGGVRNERELARFRIANGAQMVLWESAESVAWTVLLDGENTQLRVGPGRGFVRVAAMPDELTREALGQEVAFLSTAVVEPLGAAERLEGIAPPRICAAGKAQEPGIFWHPDGAMPLAGLVRWRDLG